MGAVGGIPNALGSIVLHVREHLRRWIARCSDEPGHEHDLETGIEEYFPQEAVSKEVLESQVVEVFEQFDDVLRKKPDAIPMDRLYHIVEHLSYHLGQVVLLTRLRTGTSLGFVKQGLNEAQLDRLIRADAAQEPA